MKNLIGLVVLTVACVALVIALVVTNKNAATQKKSDGDRIATLSNQWVETSANLREQKDVNTQLEKNLGEQKQAFQELTNNYTQVASDLEKTNASLKSAQEDIAARDAKIADLETQNQALNLREEELSQSITNLNTQITETKQKLASAEGDKTFLQQELQRLMAEKAALEKQFNDLVVLKAQVAKLREELTISRRLDWIRRGIFTASEQKGAERLQKVNNTPTFSSEPSNPPPAKTDHYDLNVEVHSDGSVHVIPPPTNAPAPK